jgi:poly-gamma-glutamate capsule biosynthesis protein CapA/YwtB (metallophosphatase superfamily)
MPPASYIPGVGLARPRLLVALALAGLGLSLWLALTGEARAAAAKPIRVTSKLPHWVAPGGRIVVHGVAYPDERVALRADGRIVGRTRSGPLGAYVLRGRLTGSGRQRLEVVAGGVARRIGRVLVRPVRMSAVGDVTYGEGVGVMMRQYGPRYPWLDVAPVLRRSDVSVINLETAVSNRGRAWPGKEFTFRGPPKALRATAKFAGVDVVSLANNHSLDYGRVAFADTLRFIRKFGLVKMGGGRNLKRARRPGVIEVGGLSVAFLGFSDVRPPGFDAGPGRSGATPALPELIEADVRKAARRHDLVVAYYHWGIERDGTPTARQRSLGRLTLRSGADVVLGAHPHVLQPRERKGARGRKLVAWSLGNFVFTGTSAWTRTTGILNVKLGRAGVLDTRWRRAHIVNSQPQLG